MHLRINRIKFVQHAFFFFLCTAALMMGTVSLLAQQVRQPDTELIAPKKKKAHAIKKEAEKEPLIKPDGILTKAYKSKEPWQMLSPFAPESYGDGQEMVSRNGDELGKENGLILFGIQW